MRITIIDLSESGYVVCVIDPEVILEDIIYKYMHGAGLIATDNKEFALNINEFGTKN